MPKLNGKTASTKVRCENVAQMRELNQCLPQQGSVING